MPSSITHAYFGISVYNRLSKKYKNYLDLDYINLFQQGSDPFMFYNFFIGKKAKEMNSLQELMHTKKTNLFFKNTIKYIHKYKLNNNKEIISYFYGLLCHYYLDLYIHPFIYYKAGIFDKKNKSTYKYNTMHQKLEYLIDLYFLKKHEKIPYYKFKPHTFLFKKKSISSTLAILIDNTIYETYKYKNTSNYYKKAINHMYLFYKYINYDPYSLLLITYSLIDKITSKKTIKLKELSFHNKIDNIDNILNINHQKWNLPWDKNSKLTYSFFDLYEKALNDSINTFTKVINMLEKNLLNDKLLDQLFKNKSLITGLNCNEKVIMKHFEF